MTPQEAQMLEDLVRKVEETQLSEKDPDAEALLKDGLARDPDAIYKLAQTVLIQNIALEQARAQMQRMQQQLAAPQPARATSFLGGLLHRNAPQSAPPPPPPQYQAAPPSYPPPPAYGQSYPPSYGPAYGGYGAPGGGGGFLRSAATTAAGVAGGMLAFEGIESLLHGGMGGYGGMGGGMVGGMGGGIPVEETVVNNYYDDPNAGQGGPDMQPQGPWEQGPYDTGSDLGGPNEQPQGPYDTASDPGGPNEQPQGPFDDSGSDPGLDQGFDPGQDDSDDSGGGDFGGGGGSDFV